MRSTTAGPVPLYGTCTMLILAIELSNSAARCPTVPRPAVDLPGAGHEAVDRAKRALGERGPLWWHYGSPDLNRHMAPYTDWFASLDRH